jgi:hypothetical protein
VQISIILEPSQPKPNRATCKSLARQILQFPHRHQRQFPDPRQARHLCGKRRAVVGCRQAGDVAANTAKGFQTHLAANFFNISGRRVHVRKTVLTNSIVNFGQLDGQFLHRPRYQFVCSAHPQPRPQLGHANLIQLDSFIALRTQD